MKLKNTIIVSALLSAVCLNAGWMDMATEALGSGTGNSTNDTAKEVTGECIPRMSGASTSLTQMVTEKLVTIAIEAALKEAAGDTNIQIPTKIMDTCAADKRLVYLSSLTKDFSKGVDNANKDLLESVEQTKEVQKLQAQMDHKKKTLDEAEYNEGVTEDNEQMLVLMKDAKIRDKAKYSAAMGKLAIATPINGYMVIGWDKEILEFAKDNMIWGIKNVSAVKDVAFQLETVIEILPSLSSLATSPLYDGRVDPKIAKAAGKAQMKADKDVIAKAEEENGFGDT